jgi:hypothetical protein
MENNPPKTLEEQADDLLRRLAIDTGESFRILGLIDERRARTIREREIPMATIEGRRRRHE